MAKRASLSFAAVKAAKPGQGAEPLPPADLTKPDPEAAQEKRGRGRPPVRGPELGKVYGRTRRIPGPLRLALRRLAERETESAGRIVSVHDVILQAVEAQLSRKGVKVGE
jgi:hypothetical protein